MTALKRVSDRIKMFLAKALVKSVDDSGDLQLIKISVLNGETADGIERLQSYGFTGAPPEGSEALVGYLQGNRDHGVALVVDSGAHRLTGLSNGETAQYSMHGQSLVMADSGDIDVTVPGTMAVGTPTSFVALSEHVDFMFDLINSIITNWVPPTSPAIDNGAALKTAWALAWAAARETAATKLRSE